MAGKCVMGFNVAQVEKEHELLRIIFNSPSIIQQLFENGDLEESAKHRFFWGTIADKDVKKVKEFLNEEEFI